MTTMQEATSPSAIFSPLRLANQAADASSTWRETRVGLKAHNVIRYSTRATSDRDTRHQRRTRQHAGTPHRNRCFGLLHAGLGFERTGWVLLRRKSSAVKTSDRSSQTLGCREAVASFSCLSSILSSSCHCVSPASNPSKRLSPARKRTVLRLFDLHALQLEP